MREKKLYYFGARRRFDRELPAVAAVDLRHGLAGRPQHAYGTALRFGHESVLLPLVCLMGINGADYQTTDLETLDNHWRSYDIFPMACNVQLVLYRPTGGARGDILVKALLNEREATLPIATDRFPYYRWADLRTYYINKLCNRPIVNPDFEK